MRFRELGLDFLFWTTTPLYIFLLTKFLGINIIISVILGFFIGAYSSAFIVMIIDKFSE